MGERERIMGNINERERIMAKRKKRKKGNG